jgi:hypothetical protein
MLKLQIWDAFFFSGEGLGVLFKAALSLLQIYQGRKVFFNHRVMDVNRESNYIANGVDTINSEEESQRSFTSATFTNYGTI